MYKKKLISIIKTRSGFIHIAVWIFLVILGTYIFYKRYPYSYTVPNFYAEDGKDYIVNLYNNGLAKSIFTLFNGYLIVGQYIVGYIAIIINNLFGNGFVTLPKAISIASYITLSAACTLPWLLFRRRLGSMLSLLTVILLLFTPFGGWDYAIIGTIGNLKFIFMYIAVLLVIFRNDKKICPEKSMAIYLTDIFLMICIFTNVLAVAVLPLALLRYRDLIKIRPLKSIVKKAPISMKFLFGMLTLSLIYIVIIKLKGIPEIEGYLDEPMDKLGLMNSIYRSSWFGLIYPIHNIMNYFAVFALLLIMPMTLIMKKHRVVMIVVVFGILVSALGFVVNRPGVTLITRGFVGDGGPAQFFYAGTMIFIFGFMYFISDWVKNMNKISKSVFLYFAVIYLFISIPYANTSRLSQAQVFNRPNIYASLQEACLYKGEFVVVEIYPTEKWELTIKRDVACQGQ